MKGVKDYECEGWEMTGEGRGRSGGMKGVKDYECKGWEMTGDGREKCKGRGCKIREEKYRLNEIERRGENGEWRRD